MHCSLQFSLKEVPVRIA